jgi:hypothetical protein
VELLPELGCRVIGPSASSFVMILFPAALHDAA